MRKLTSAIMLCVAIITLATACHDTETYADQRKRETRAINAFIVQQGIKVISEEEFLVDTTTDVSKNEYVLFDNSGVYMQIISRGNGKAIANGESTTLLCRFTEANLLQNPSLNPDSCLSNNVGALSYMPDKMTVTNTAGTFEASFDSGLMYSTYSSASVPGGWLLPLSYLRPGRDNSLEPLAKVKLIVPSAQGHTYASSGVYPCFYEISYERGL